LGTFLGLVWIGVGVVAAWHVARRAKSTADSPWHSLLQELLNQCGIRRAIEVRECPQVSVPMTWGLFRPVILVPAGSAAWSDEIKRSVLLHELGHIRRGDCPMLLLGRLACVAYWFHPLAWLAVRQLRKTSEQAADDLVLASNIAPPDYAEHLVGIAARMRGLRLFGHVALPMASPSDLEGRVLAILDPRRNHRGLKRKTCYALMLLAVLLVVPCAILRLGYAQDKKPESIPAEKGVPEERKAPQKQSSPQVTDRKDQGELAVAEARYNVAMARAEDTINIRYAMAAAEAIRAEYELNKKTIDQTPGWVYKQHLDELLLKCKEADLAVEKARRYQRIAEEEAKVAKAELDRAKRKAAVEETAPAVPGEKRDSGPAKAGTTSGKPAPAEDKPVVVEGTVTDPQGKPLAGATVGQFEKDSRLSLAKATTDQNGHYRLPPSKPGEFNFAAVISGCAPASRLVTVGRDQRTVDLQLRQGETIRLRVVDKEGKPVPGAKVVVGARRPEQWLIKYLETDAHGRWSQVWTPGERLDLYVTKAGFATVETDLAPADREEVIALAERSWTASGRVVDHETKAPISRFHLWHGTPMNDEIEWNDRLVNNVNGQYSIHWDGFVGRPEHHLLRVEADGYVPSEDRKVVRIEHDVKFDVDLVKGQPISGTVRSAAGKPLANADVVLCTAARNLSLCNGRETWGRCPKVRTGADGRYSFSPQREPYVLEALDDHGYAEVAGGPETKDITIRQRWARVEGTVRIGNQPAAKQYVVINFEKTSSRPDDSSPMDWIKHHMEFSYQTETDSEGRFVFDRVRPGKANVVRCVVENYIFGRPTESIPIEVVAGETRKVVFQASGDKGETP
jgi:protocatechuate 3,4-dioxygenase beta subunit